MDPFVVTVKTLAPQNETVYEQREVVCGTVTATIVPAAPVATESPSAYATYTSASLISPSAQHLESAQYSTSEQHSSSAQRSAVISPPAAPSNTHPWEHDTLYDTPNLANEVWIIVALGQSNNEASPTGGGLGGVASSNVFEYTWKTSSGLPPLSAGNWGPQGGMIRTPIGCTDAFSVSDADLAGRRTPSITFANNMSSANPTVPILIVPTALQGTGLLAADTNTPLLSCWETIFGSTPFTASASQLTWSSADWKNGTGGVLYGMALARVTAAARAAAAMWGGKMVRIKALTWIQGEQDAVAGTSQAAYATALQHLIASLRSDLALPYTPFLMGGWGDAGEYGVAAFAAIDAARTSATRAFPRTALLKSTAANGWTAATSNGDGYHYSGLGMTWVGSWMYAQYAAYRAPSSPSYASSPIWSAHAAQDSVTMTPTRSSALPLTRRTFVASMSLPSSSAPALLSLCLILSLMLSLVFNPTRTTAPTLSPTTPRPPSATASPAVTLTPASE